MTFNGPRLTCYACGDGLAGSGGVFVYDRMMRGLQANLIEVDEQWDFIAKKQKRVRQGDPDEMGECWLYVALAATQKTVIGYRVGKRNDANMEAFLGDLRQRIVNRPQITSDGYPGYPSAMEATFGYEVDYAQIVKRYALDSTEQDAAHRYSPSKVVSSERTVIRGRPAEEYISTSYVERFNLSSRMQMRRFTRLTNAFSKKLANHQAAIALSGLLLQSVPRSRNAAHDASDGPWSHGSYLVDWGTNWSRARAVRRAAIAASNAPRHAWRTHSIQTIRN